LRFSTDNPLGKDGRYLALVCGDILDGSWEYSIDLDQDSYFQYLVTASDGSNFVSTGWVSYNEESLLHEMMLDFVSTIIVVLLIAAVVAVLAIVALRTRAKQL